MGFGFGVSGFCRGRERDLHEIVDELFVSEAEGRGGLIENDERGLCEDKARKGQALLLTWWAQAGLGFGVRGSGWDAGCGVWGLRPMGQEVEIKKEDLVAEEDRAPI